MHWILFFFLVAIFFLSLPLHLQFTSSITLIKFGQFILWMITIFNLPCDIVFVSHMCIVLVSLCCCKIFCPFFLSFFLPAFVELWWAWMQHKVLHFPLFLQFLLFALFFFHYLIGKTNLCSRCASSSKKKVWKVFAQSQQLFFTS
jgi:hypothetical protein